MKKLLFLMAFLLCTWGYANSGQAASPSPSLTSGAWPEKMRSLYGALSELLTDVTSDRRFNDPANRPRIQAQAEKIASLSHDLGKIPAPDSDPSLRILGGLLEKEARFAATALKNGNRSYARAVLRTIPSYCIACHTRNGSGPRFESLPIEPAIASLSSAERGEFFLATRQYDRATEELAQAIRDPKFAQKDPMAWRRAVQGGLTVAVRVQKSPQQAQEVVNAVLALAEAPAFAKSDAEEWKASVREWKSEKKKPLKTAAALRTEAGRLMARAREVQKYPLDRTADVFYLRASSTAHDLLQTTKGDRQTADALLMAGLSYEVLSPLRMETVHELFYESCIRRFPRTQTAQLCYRRLEESVIFGYTGSGGTDLPPEALDRLAELKNLSRVPGVNRSLAPSP